jgi:hypothetical protein
MAIRISVINFRLTLNTTRVQHYLSAPTLGLHAGL